MTLPTGVSHGYDRFSQTIGFVVFISTHSLSLLCFALYLLLYGHLIVSKITQSTSSIDSSHATRILPILHRINSIMTICTLCYFFRISLIFIKLYSIFFDQNGILPSLSPPLWYATTDVLPSLLPNLSFLYVMKITSIPPNSGENNPLPSYHNRSWYYQDEDSSNPLYRQSEFRGSFRSTLHLDRRLLP